MSPSPQITELLNALARGESAASDRLLPLVYDHLRRIAIRRMAGESPGHTLQATALVHEAYLKMVGDQPLSWQSRGQFYHAAAEGMRRILVDHARSRGRLKRGGGRSREPLNVLDLAEENDPAQILALDEALERMEEVDPRMTQVVRLRFFAGLSIEEAAAAMDVSPRTVKREWTCARAWLYRALRGSAET